MPPKGDQLRILWALRRALNRHDVRAFCKKHKIASTTVYQATNPKCGNPSLRVLLRLVNALGYELCVRPKAGSVRPQPGFPKPLPAAARAEREALVAAAEARA